MKSLLPITLAALTALSFTGCISYNNQVPTGNIPLKPIETTATYDVLGDAKGTATGSFLFGCIKLGDQYKSGSIGSFGMLADPVQQAAIYDAIESVPTADALIAPRFTSTTTSYVVYSEKTVTVKGKAIRYNPSVK